MVILLKRYRKLTKAEIDSHIPPIKIKYVENIFPA